MIVTKLKPKDEILTLLKDFRNIFIIGCGSCAKQCRTGGEDDVLKMKQELAENGKEITGFVVPDETCNIPLVKRDIRKVSENLKKAQVVLVMSCGAGVAAVLEAVPVRAVPALDTVSLGNTIRQGDFAGRCSLCGECILGETGGLCLMTLCPKNMLNGPCGGMGNGKCEVYTDEDCIWVRIYNKEGAEALKKIRDPKNNSKTARGSRLKIC